MGSDVAVRQVTVRALGDDAAVAARLRAAREAAGGGVGVSAPSSTIPFGFGGNEAPPAASLSAPAESQSPSAGFPALQLQPQQQQQQQQLSTMPSTGVGTPSSAASAAAGAASAASGGASLAHVTPARTLMSDAILESLSADDALQLLGSSKSAPAFAFTEAVTTARDFPDDIAANALVAISKRAEAISASCIALPRRLEGVQRGGLFFVIW
jgi:hypothetical protein